MGSIGGNFLEFSFGVRVWAGATAPQRKLINLSEIIRKNKMLIIFAAVRERHVALSRTKARADESAVE